MAKLEFQCEIGVGWSVFVPVFSEELAQSM